MSERDWHNKPSAEGLGLLQDLLGIPNNQFLSKGDLSLQQQGRMLEAIEKVTAGLSPTEMRVICENPQDNTQVLERVRGQLHEVLSDFMSHSTAMDYARMHSDESWRDEQRDMDYVRQRQQQAIATFFAQRLADLQQTAQDISGGVSDVGAGIAGIEQSLESVDDTLGYMAGDVADISSQTREIRGDIGNVSRGVASVDRGVRRVGDGVDTLNRGVDYVGRGVSQLNIGVQRVGDEVAHVGRGVSALHKGQAIQTRYLDGIYRTMNEHSDDMHQMLGSLAEIAIRQTQTVSDEFELTREHTQQVFQYAVGEVVAALTEMEMVLSDKLAELCTSVDGVADELHTANVDRMRLAVGGRVREAHIYKEGNTASARACETAIDALTLDPSCFEQVFDGSWDDTMVRDRILVPLSKRHGENPSIQVVCLLQANRMGEQELATLAATRLFECAHAGVGLDAAMWGHLVKSMPEVFPLLRELAESSPWSEQSAVLFFLCKALMAADFEIEYARRTCLAKAFKIDPEIQAYKRSKRMDLIVAHLRLKLGAEVGRLKKYAEFSRRLRGAL